MWVVQKKAITGVNQPRLRIHDTQEWYDLYQPVTNDELQKFFDRYTKGIENGWESTPKVRVSLLGYNEVGWPFDLCTFSTRLKSLSAQHCQLCIPGLAHSRNQAPNPLSHILRHSDSGTTERVLNSDLRRRRPFDPGRLRPR